MVENPTFDTIWVFSNDCFRYHEETAMRRIQGILRYVKSRRDETQEEPAGILRYVKSRRDETQEEPAGFYELSNHEVVRHEKILKESSK